MMKHVVLVTYGEPVTPSFADQLVYSWRILLGLTRSVADIPAPLIPLIALSRARGRTAMWKRADYASPLEPITRNQAAQLHNTLMRRPADQWSVHVAYEFRAPLLPALLRTLPRGEPVFVVPMYAADSAFTHELTRSSIEDLAASHHAPIEVLPAIDVSALIQISVDHVMRAVAADRADSKTSALVLAAHGTLLKPEKPIETGLVATEQLCAGIRDRLSSRFGMIANGWLNHSRGGKWTDPPIEETLQHVSDSGFRDVIYYPYGFLADNAESQLEGRLAAAAFPHLRVRFVPCLNESPDLTEAIATQVLIAHAGTGASPRARLPVPA
jgi:protoheme ferro-lyase